MFTEDEIKCLNLSRDLWNEFVKLPENHPMDKQEFIFHIHAIQNIILARPGVKELKVNYYEPSNP